MKITKPMLLNDKMFYHFCVEQCLVLGFHEASQRAKNVNVLLALFKHWHHSIPERFEAFTVVIATYVIEKILVLFDAQYRFYLKY